MRRPPRNHFWPSILRRGCAVVTLIAYLCAAIGLPLPARSETRQAAGACQSGGCACPAEAQSAHRCCCCCAPPGGEGSQCESDAPGPSSESDSTADTDSASPGCCEGEGHGEERPAPAPTEAPTDTPQGPVYHWPVGMSAMKCLGLTVYWVVSGTIADAPLAVDWHPVPLGLDWLCCFDLNGARLPTTPAEPPPKSLQR